MIPSCINKKSSSGQHPARRSRQHPAGRDNVLQFTHLLQTQISCLYECFDRDEDVLCLAEASKDTNQTIKLLRGTTGTVYFGSEGPFGLCRYQSLKMVATSCRLRNKIEFVDQCQTDTSHCVECIVSSVQRECLLAGAPRKYVLATIDKELPFRKRYCVIPSLRLKIYIRIYFREHDSTTRRVRTWFEDKFSIYDETKPQIRHYRGLAFPVACSCDPLLIPSENQIEEHHLQAILHRSTFLIAIWKNDSTAVTPVEYSQSQLAFLLALSASLT